MPWFQSGGTADNPIMKWTVTTPVGTVPTYVAWTPVADVWWSNAATQTATTTGFDYYAQAAAALQTATTTAPAYERYQMNPYRPSSLGGLFRPSAPSLITHQEQARTHEALYRRALAEHNDQEAARMLRLIEARAASAAERQRLIEQQQQQHHEEMQRRSLAKDRARALLFEHLNPAQRETFEHNGWFIVEGGRSKTRYRIRASEHMAGNVDVLRDRDSRVTHRLCAHARLGTVPLGDQLLAQKVMIELAEDDFLRIANRHAA